MKLVKWISLTLLAASLSLLGGCQLFGAAQSSSANSSFTKSSLPGGGLALPENERIHLSTDKQWIAAEGHLSDLIRLQWTAAQAKPAIAWADEKGVDKTAIISHDKANNPEQHDHKHISIETTMSPTGKHKDELFTRFEIPYDTDVADIRTHSSNFNVMDGILRVASKEDKVIQFAKNDTNNVITPVWSLRASSGEQGGNTGADFHITRHDDQGKAMDSAVTVSRQKGNVGIGTAEPESKLDVNGDRIRIRNSNTPESAHAPGKVGDIVWDNNYIYICVAKDTWKRTELKSW
ncbi:hypothetical protein [Paenibacillus sp. YPG26]|uniref:hypothetical protein n=1 Tax=Paenibacillus sp. YPG26 TaxID=2878915 RepID=UPI00203F518F|nr:hypothetical protein [Paenibacillus sp. YPG26]USB33625.1 hypothetical protein LDO05_02020 [Paenibacillus sp. YPG26]